MPHSFPGAHHPAIANIIKIVFIKIASAFFATKKIITFNKIFATFMGATLYWLIVYNIAPGDNKKKI